MRHSKRQEQAPQVKARHEADGVMYVVVGGLTGFTSQWNFDRWVEFTGAQVEWLRDESRGGTR